MHPSFKRASALYFLFVLVLGSFLIIGFNDDNIVKAASFTITFENTVVGYPYSDSQITIEGAVITATNPYVGSRCIVSTAVDDYCYQNLTYSGFLVSYSAWVYGHSATAESANTVVLKMYNNTLGVSNPIIQMKFVTMGSPSTFYAYYYAEGAYHAISYNMDRDAWRHLTITTVNNLGDVRYICDGEFDVSGLARNCTAINNNYTIDCVLWDLHSLFSGGYWRFDNIYLNFQTGYVPVNNYAVFTITSMYNSTICASVGSYVTFSFTSSYATSDIGWLLVNQTNYIVNFNILMGSYKNDYSVNVFIPYNFVDGIWRFGVYDYQALIDCAGFTDNDGYLVNDSRAEPYVTWYNFSVCGDVASDYALFTDKKRYAEGEFPVVYVKAPVGEHVKIVLLKYINSTADPYSIVSVSEEIVGTGKVVSYSNKFVEVTGNIYTIIAYFAGFTSFIYDVDGLSEGVYLAKLYDLNGASIDNTSYGFSVGLSYDFYTISVLPSSRLDMSKGYFTISGYSFDSSSLCITCNGTMVYSSLVFGAYSVQYNPKVFGTYTFYLEQSGVVVSRVITRYVYTSAASDDWDDNFYPDGTPKPFPSDYDFKPVIGFALCLVFSFMAFLVTRIPMAFATTFFGSMLFFSIPGQPFSLFPVVLLFIIGLVLSLLLVYFLIRR